MEELLRKIYHKLSGLAIVRAMGKMYLDGFPIGNQIAYNRIKKVQKNCNRKSPIKVVFLAQVSELWNKQSDIYNAMKENPLFEPVIFLIPQFDIVNNKLETEYTNSYFIENYKDLIKSYNKGKWYDLKSLKPDYVFYQRPYDSYLPKEYRSSEVSKYSKCCYVPYGYAGADVFNEGNTNKLFFRNIYMTFLESGYMASLLKKKFKKSVRNKVQFFENIGYPSLSRYFSIESVDEFSRVLWTPRWSYDPVLGGSNYLKYKDTLFKIKEEFGDSSVTFRPHPLLWRELRNKSLMTEKEIKNYLEQIKAKDIVYDTDSPLFTTLNKTDILITDYSSIMIEFFLTGRPIIYCDGGIELNKEYSNLVKSMYVAHNEEEIMKYVKDLKNGNDYLKDKRNAMIKKYKEKHLHAKENIVKFIEDDFKTTY